MKYGVFVKTGEGVATVFAVRNDNSYQYFNRSFEWRKYSKYPLKPSIPLKLAAPLELLVW